MMIGRVIQWELNTDDVSEVIEGTIMDKVRIYVWNGGNEDQYLVKCVDGSVELIKPEKITKIYSNG